MPAITSGPSFYIAIAATLILVLLAVITQRAGYTIISILFAAAAWLALAFVGMIFLINSWGL
jgi:hypothetical protein